MQLPNRPFRNASRILAATALLLLALLAVIQRSPAVRHRLGIGEALAVTKPPKADRQIPADEDSGLLSGSAVSGAHFNPPALITPAALENSTIEVDLPVGTRPKPSADVEIKLDAIQRRLEELSARRVEPPSIDCSPLTNAIERLESQAAEVKSTLARLEVADQHLEEKLESDAHRATPQRITIRSRNENHQTQVTIEARDASLPELLVRLGEAAGINLLISPDVAGNVSVHLQLPDAQAGLEAVCRIHSCRIERSGPILVVSRMPVVEMAPAASRPVTMTKLYRLKHLSAQVIRPYVVGLLTPELGTVSFASIRERVAGTVYRDPPRAILVKDTPAVISDVDRLILELDRPLDKGGRLPAPPKPRPLPATPISQANITEPMTPANDAPYPKASCAAPAACVDRQTFEPPILPSAVHRPGH